MLVMTEKLANQLMDTLTCVYISAMGGVPTDENGEVCMTNEQFEAVELYARSKFCEILEEFEENLGEEWKIECEEEEGE